MASGDALWHRWAPGDDVRGLQLVVGCDGTVDELVAGAVQSPRRALVVTAAAEEPLEQTVAGLDEARRLRLTFGAGREDDLADEVLDSVSVDSATVAAACVNRPL
ncbi:MAG: hypothetical protein WD645_02565 [Dehalococcoidia bacterium]